MRRIEHRCFFGCWRHSQTLKEFAFYYTSAEEGMDAPNAENVKAPLMSFACHGQASSSSSSSTIILFLLFHNPSLSPSPCMYVLEPRSRMSFSCGMSRNGIGLPVPIGTRRIKSLIWLYAMMTCSPTMKFIPFQDTFYIRLETLLCSLVTPHSTHVVPRILHPSGLAETSM